MARKPAYMTWNNETLVEAYSRAVALWGQGTNSKANNKAMKDYEVELMRRLEKATS